MKFLRKMTIRLVLSCDANPFLCVAMVMLFFVMFNVLEWTVEKLLFGQGFVHWLDPLFQLCFIAYSGYVVHMCACYREEIDRR